jgi:hypothetical protein
MDMAMASLRQIFRRKVPDLSAFIRTRRARDPQAGGSYLFVSALAIGRDCQPPKKGSAAAPGRSPPGEDPANFNSKKTHECPSSLQAHAGTRSRSGFLDAFVELLDLMNPAPAASGARDHRPLAS